MVKKLEILTQIVPDVSIYPYYSQQIDKVARDSLLGPTLAIIFRVSTRKSGITRMPP